MYKSLSLVPIVWLCISSLSVMANPGTKKISANIESCIAENSGAGSSICLQNILDALDADLLSTHQQVDLYLAKRMQQQSITETHFVSAVENIQRVAKHFIDYRESYCTAFAAASGAAASGYQQHRLACLIKQTYLHYESIQTIMHF